MTMFALGYARTTALHPVGLTERARRRCAATLGETSAPKLLLGQLEGIWAVIYNRRAAIEKMHAGAFQKVLDAMAKLDWDAIADAVTTQQLIDPSITGEQLAGELRIRINDMITGDLPAADRAAWQATMSDAVLDGLSEGQTAARAILAHTGGVEIDWELSAKEAKAALTRGTVLGDSVDRWIQEQTRGLGYQVSRKLASMWDAGATKKEMIQAVQDILGSSSSVAQSLMDTAIGSALSQGALDTYLAAGVPNADFVTAGDSRVCIVCASYEDGSPYPIGECPQPPVHLSCRCTVAPSDFFPKTEAS